MLGISFLQEVEASSPAALAGLQPHTDYIVGADQLLQDVRYNSTLPLTVSIRVTLKLVSICSQRTFSH